MFLSKFLCFFLLGALSVPQGDSANIIGLYTLDIRSHYLIAQNLLKELAKSGHNVTVFTGFKTNNLPPNYREVKVDLPNLDEFKKSMAKDGSIFNMMRSVGNFREYLKNASTAVVKCPEMQEFLTFKQKADLIMVGFSESPVLLGISKALGVPVVMTSTQKLGYFLEYFIGAYAHDSFIPNMMVPYSSTRPMTFGQRLFNTCLNWLFRAFVRVSIWTQQDTYTELYPTVNGTLWDAISQSVQLMLMNSHFTLDRPMPYMTNMIEVGGMQIPDDVNPLPTDLQTFIDASPDGVIYFCMGQTLKMRDLDADKKKSIVNGLKATKLPVIIKWDDETTIGELSRNKKFFASNWLPQNDILANPKVKAYVTHGGLLSTTEAIYHGVPIVGIPIFGDQLNNIQKFMELGIAAQVDFETLSADSLAGTINGVISDKTFTRNTKELSRRYRDRPMTPTQTAKYWVEYVLRHKNAEFMHSPAKEMGMVEYFNWDVVAVILGSVLVSIYISWKVTKWGFKKVIGLCVRKGKKCKGKKQKMN